MRGHGPGADREEVPVTLLAFAVVAMPFAGAVCAVAAVLLDTALGRRVKRAGR